MRLAFTKLHGAGNDFVLIDVRGLDVEAVAVQAAFIADRHFGVGCDQVLLLNEHPEADVQMLIYNPDGSSAEMCGNGIRAFAHYVWSRGIRPRGPLRVATGAGTLTVTPDADGVRSTVAMGIPRFRFRDLKFDAAAFAATADDEAVALMRDDWPREVLPEPGVGVSLGNPHVVFFVPDTAAIDLLALGPRLEHDPAFSERSNIEFVTPRDDGIEVRVWERGAGATLACGTGACAAAVATIRRGLATSPLLVRLPGGTLTVAWDSSGSVYLSGPAVEVFSGTLDLAAATAFKEARGV